MFRQSIARPLVRANSPAISRSFSVAAVRMGAGDTGAPKVHGYKADDSFSRREAAQESMYIHEKETEKLKALKAKIEEQRKHLAELDKHIDELTRSQGGEKN